MIEFSVNLGKVDAPGATGLTLDFEGRSRSRQKVTLDNGREAAVVLPHGTGMREGDVLRARDGSTAVVRCLPEAVATARGSTWPLVAKAAYHLGNRHMALQLGDLFLRIQPDPVLEKMLASLGLDVKHETTAFVPEAGAAELGHGAGGHHHHAHSA